MAINGNAVISDETLLNCVLQKAISEDSLPRLCKSLRISGDIVCDILIKSKIFHLFPKYIMKRLHENGVSYFDLIAVYGFDILCLSKTFFQHEPEYYYGKSVNYLKILSHVNRPGAVHFVCECLACGSVGYEIKKYTAINGLIKSCGCLPKGKRIPDDFPIRNENLHIELKELTEKLLEAGVLFNNESKIINKIKKGEKSAEKIAIELNCALDYVYKVARKRGYSECINQFSAMNLYNKNKAKVVKMMPLIKHGNAGIVCQEFGISHETYLKYKKIIEDEKCNKETV